MKRLPLALLTLTTLALSSLTPAAFAARGDDSLSSEEKVAQCQLTPEQDRANAEAAVKSAAQRTMATTADVLKSSYSNVNYDLSVGSTNVNGNNATVNGSVTLRAINLSNKQTVGGTYQGVVTLVRNGCNWDAVGYSRG